MTNLLFGCWQSSCVAGASAAATADSTTAAAVTITATLAATAAATAAAADTRHSAATLEGAQQTAVEAGSEMAT